MENTQNTQTFRFDSLNRAPTELEIAEYKKYLKKSNNDYTSWALWLTVLAAVIFNFFTNGTEVFASGVMVVWLVGMILFFHVASSRAKVRGAKLYVFAKDNELIYVPERSKIDKEGAIFGIGSGRSLVDIFKAPEGIEVANYRYTTGSGKTTQSHHWSYLAIKLERHLPHMILDARANNWFGNSSNLPQALKGTQKLLLEGDFNNYFTLYAPEEYKTDALYVFTPDVMLALVESSHNYDIEIIDDTMYVYQHTFFDFTRPETWNEIHKLVSVLRPELHKQTKHYADEKIGDRSQDIVASQGRRLKSNNTFVYFFVAIVIFLIFIFTVVYK